MQLFVNGRPQALDAAESIRNAVLFAPPEEEARAKARMALPADLESDLHKQSTHFESRYEMDYLLLNVPRLDDVAAPHKWAAVYLCKTGLLVLHDGLPEAAQMQAELAAWQGEFPAPDRVFMLLLAHLTTGDTDALADIEEEISALEDRIMDKNPENCTAQISDLRSRLMVLRRYYEGLFDALEDMEENENGLVSRAQLKYLRLQTNKVDRLSRAVGNLRDYVTQVRESYQNQLDIGLNETMKLFTVITAIFLPLTLIAGWYGMNLNMPEYAFPYSYPIIIAISLVVALGCVWYFKRHKWF